MSQAHILVVDDDPTVRTIIESFLAGQGYRVTACDGGDAMWAALAADPVDLVILDVEMPGEDGYSLAHRLRQNSAVGIILLTSHTDPEHKIYGLEIGADDFLSKPCDRRELLARVKSLLRRAAAAAGTVPQRPAPQRPAVCPVCGSRLRWSLESDAGAIGSCKACGWSKFYAG
jgi:two-component system, OmpR family, response regulator